KVNKKSVYEMNRLTWFKAGFHYIRNICLQNILMNDLYIIIWRQRLFQNGKEALVNFIGCYLISVNRQLFCESTDARSNFYGASLLVNTCFLDNVIQDIGIDNKILS